MWCQTVLRSPKKCHLHHISASLSLSLKCRLSRVSCSRLCLHVQPHQSQAPRLPDSDRQKREFFRFFHRCCCERRTKESNMECQLGVSRDTDQGVYSSGALERYKRFQVPRSLGKEVTQALRRNRRLSRSHRPSRCFCSGSDSFHVGHIETVSGGQTVDANPGR